LSQNDRAPQVQQGGIVDKPMPIDASKRDDHLPALRTGHARQAPAPSAPARAARVCAHCNEQLEVGA